MLLRFGEAGFLGFRHFALEGEHGPLGIDDLRDGADHVEDSVHPQAFILRLIHLWGIGHKEPDQLVGIDHMGAQPQAIHRLRQLGRPVARKNHHEGVDRGGISG